MTQGGDSEGSAGKGLNGKKALLKGKWVALGPSLALADGGEGRGKGGSWVSESRNPVGGPNSGGSVRDSSFGVLSEPPQAPSQERCPGGTPDRKRCPIHAPGRRYSRPDGRHPRALLSGLISVCRSSL